MTDPIFQSDATYALAAKLMDASALRQHAIASNIANSETPGYRRLDLSADFSSQLRAAMSTGTTPEGLASIQPKLVEDATARTVRPDGNSVDLERELLAMDQNSVEYGYLAEIVSGSLKQMRTAISGTVTS
jgi:flagellar basal-body rod protein FlgB